MAKDDLLEVIVKRAIGPFCSIFAPELAQWYKRLRLKHIAKGKATFTKTRCRKSSYGLTAGVAGAARRPA